MYEPPQYMTVNTAIQQILDSVKEDGREQDVLNEKSLCVGVARLGSADQIIKAGIMMARSLLFLDVSGISLASRYCKSNVFALICNPF